MPRTKFDQTSFATAGTLKTAFAEFGYSEPIIQLATYFLDSNDLSIVLGKTAEGLWRIQSPLTGYDVLDQHDGDRNLRRAYVLEELQHVMSNYVRGYKTMRMSKAGANWTYTIVDNSDRAFSGANTKQVEALASAMINFLSSSADAAMLTVAQRFS